MKRLFALIVLMAVTAGVLTGCDGGAGGGGTSTDTNAPAAANTNQ
ncbi:MAG TPA: hypothetical protein VEC99_07115 [Clostridia bacterium]|nr:hypothetical protein [Clostridia bacterium]